MAALAGAGGVRLGKKRGKTPRNGESLVGLRVGKDLHGWVVGSQVPPLRLFWGFI